MITEYAWLLVALPLLGATLLLLGGLGQDLRHRGLVRCLGIRLLGGQRLRPQRAQAVGFAWQHPTLAGALEQLLHPPGA